MSIKDVILKAGIENCLFMVPMRPLQSVFGLIHYKSSNDPEVIVPATISEKRYKVSESYKITLKSMYYEAFGTESFYISDLDRLIKDGVINFYIKHVNESK